MSPPLPPPVVSADQLVAWQAGARPPGHEGTRLVVADVRWYLDGRDGRAAYEQRHLPGAVWVDLDHALSRADLPVTEGRHPLPTPEAFAEAMAALGIGDDALVVAYDDSGGSTAGRLVVMLRWLGRPASLLDGGLGAWPGDTEQGAGRSPAPATFSPGPWPEHVVATADETAEAALDPHRLVLDARAHERYTGAVALVDPRVGHVPGALSAPWADNLDPETSRLLGTDELQARYGALGVADADDVIVHCGSGVSACLDLLAMEHAGFEPPRLFVGSWSAWSADPDRPAVLGDEPLGPPASTGMDAAHDLRRTRRRHRVEELEWFEALYRVYLAALIGGGAVLFLSGLVPDEPVDAAGVLDVAQHGPRVLGLLVVLVVALGLRSGAQGGPLAVERADVVHLFMAPLPRHLLLRRPALQRVRSLAFGGALLGAVAGQLAARRLPGEIAEWALWGALAGAALGTLHSATALTAHALRLPRWLATLLGAAVLGWQGAAIATSGTVPGPGDPLGRLLVAPVFDQPVPVSTAIALVLIAALVVAGVALVGRTSLEAMVRRSGLVAQLRFAVTVQDLRTVMLLRRQLSQEQTRSRPWFRLRGSSGHPVWRRAWRGLARFPASRLARMALLTVAASALLVAAHRGTTPAVVLAGLLLFVVGLEASEPLAEALDQPDLTGSFTRHSGRLHLAHLAAPALALVPFALLGVATAVVLEPSRATAAVAAVVALPVLLGAMGGAALNVLRGAPDPLARTERSLFMPPEVSGFTTLARTVWPPAVAVLATLPVLLVRRAAEQGTHVVVAAAQAAAIAGLVAVAVAWWVLRRDDLRRRWHDMMAQADATRAGAR